LLQWRQAALAVFNEFAIPDRVRHLWRYTDPRRLLPQDLDRLHKSEPELASDDLSGWDRSGNGPVVVVHPTGRLELNQAARACGLSLRGLGSDPADVTQLGSAVPPGHGLFEALNGSLWQGGLYVHLPSGLKLDQPLRIIVPAGGTVALPRLLVVAGAGAVATVVEEHLGGTAASQVVMVSEFLVGPKAQVRHVLLQRWQPGAVGHLTCRARLEQDAEYLAVFASFGGAVAKLDLGADLIGTGARSEMVGVTLAEGRQHFDLHTEHRHLARHTWSNLDFKVALTGRSRSVYTGLIRIAAEGAGSEAYQENRNLLLSPHCRAETIPELEILTNDVSCSHGATAAPVDPEQLFYLASRGIPAAAALGLVVQGFLADTLGRLPEPLQTEIAKLVATRLERFCGGR
jgi:Fe-S cluster assembly protein SufD